MLTTKRMIVKGNVQLFGFRILVKKFALKHKLKGVVQNLSDGDVEILCKGNENNIKKFKKDIETLKRSDKDIMKVHVSKVNEYSSGFDESRIKKSFRIEKNPEIDEEFKTTNVGILKLGVMEDKLDSINDKYGRISNDMEFIRKDIHSISQDFKKIVNKK